MADLNFLNIDNCDAITFNTPTTDLQYIEYITGSVVRDFTDVDKYTITTSTNCCSPGVTTNVAPRYQLVPTIDSCVISPSVAIYSIKIAGINANLIQQTQVSLGGSPYFPISFSNINDELFIELTQGHGVAILDWSLRFITVSGFQYDVAATITQTLPKPPALQCDGVLSNVSIVYPELPSNVVYANQEAFATSGVLTPTIGFEFEIVADNPGTIGNSITLVLDGINDVETIVANWNAANPTNTATVTYTLGSNYSIAVPPSITLSGGVDTPTFDELSVNELYGLDVMPAGVYEIIFCEVLYDTTSTCIQNHVFLDCGSLKCAVVNKLVQCVDSNLMDIYNALVWGNECTDSVSYAEFCALYEILIIILETDGCFGRLDECNCSDATTIANKLSPVSYPTQTNHSPCQSC